jgi:D-3-phosphoglycerate dehydrogenase
MSIHYYDPFLTSDKIIGLIGTCESNIDHLFKYSDIISIHIPLNDTTKGIINGRLMNLMPKNSIIINTSRGEIWDENALAKSIKQNKIAGAATDVLSNEFDQTEINKNPLILLQSKGFPIIITPHIAGATFDSMHATELYMAQKFNNTLNG